MLKKEHIKKVSGIKNLTGIGIGYKKIKGKKTKELSLVCTVVEKLEPHKLKQRDKIPKKIDGIPTDVVQTGEIKIFPAIPSAVAFENIDRMRPARPGISIGHKDISAGTFGFVGYKNGSPMIISNNHVMAHSNDAEIGDEILQPGPYDGGTIENDHLADLARYKEIGFASATNICKVAQAVAWLPNFLAKSIERRTRLVPVRPGQVQITYEDPGDDPTGTFPKNYIDAAMARPIRDDMIDPYIVEIGVPDGDAIAELDMPVRKSGRTTGYTEGKVSIVEYSMTVKYGEGKEAWFLDQFAIEHSGNKFSAPGDSGSGVLNELYLTGLLFAGSDVMTVCNNIHYIIDEFGITING